jgi:hypothetical protein
MHALDTIVTHLSVVVVDGRGTLYSFVVDKDYIGEYTVAYLMEISRFSLS